MHRAATWGCMAWGRSLGMRGAVVTRGCVSPGQVRANPRFGKLLQRGLCRQGTSAPPPHAPPPHAPPPRLHGRAALLAGVAPSGAGAGQEMGGGWWPHRLSLSAAHGVAAQPRRDLPGGAISREVRSPGRCDLLARRHGPTLLSSWILCTLRGRHGPTFLKSARAVKLNLEQAREHIVASSIRHVVRPQCVGSAASAWCVHCGVSTPRPPRAAPCAAAAHAQRHARRRLPRRRGCARAAHPPRPRPRRGVGRRRRGSGAAAGGGRRRWPWRR